MKTVLKILLGLLAAAVVISLCLELAGLVVGTTVGIIGGVLGVFGVLLRAGLSLVGVVCKVLISPVVLVLVIVFLLWNRTRHIQPK